MDIAKELQDAVTHHTAGRTAEAAAIYRRVLEVDANHPDALNLLGVIERNNGNVDVAIELGRKAIAAAPRSAAAHSNLGYSYLAKRAARAAVDQFQQAILFDPRLTAARDGLRSAQDAHHRSLIAANPVVELNVEVTTWCNLECQGCGRTVAMRKDEYGGNRHMSLKTFKKVIDNLPSIPLLNLTGIGETTLQPHLPEMVAYARSSGKFRTISFSTNAMARNLDYYRKCVAAGLTSLIVSVDSLDHEVAQKMRKGTDVKKLKTRIREFAELGNVHVETHVTVGRHNLEDVPSTVAALAEIGCLNLSMSRMMGEFDARGYYDPQGICLEAHEMDNFHRVAQELKAVHGHRFHSFRIVGFDIDKVIRNTKDGSICGRPISAPAITVDGLLTPCCVSFDGDHFGNVSVADMPLAAAYEQPQVREWLRVFLNGRHPLMCTSCTNNPTLERY